MHELRPSIDGSPLEVCLAILLGDYAPSEATALIGQFLDPQDETARLIANARTDFFRAAHLSREEDLDESLALIWAAKQKLRMAALMWLAERSCPCCVTMRARLEREIAAEG